MHCHRSKEKYAHTGEHARNYNARARTHTHTHAHTMHVCIFTYTHLSMDGAPNFKKEHLHFFNLLRREGRLREGIDVIVSTQLLQQQRQLRLHSTAIKATKRSRP